MSGGLLESSGIAIRGFVVAGGSAGFAVHQSVFADADIELRLAQDAELIALALIFHHFALAAAKFGGSSSGRHDCNFIERRRDGECAIGNR